MLASTGANRTSSNTNNDGPDGADRCSSASAKMRGSSSFDEGLAGSSVSYSDKYYFIVH